MLDSDSPWLFLLQNLANGRDLDISSVAKGGSERLNSNILVLGGEFFFFGIKSFT